MTDSLQRYPEVSVELLVNDRLVDSSTGRTGTAQPRSEQSDRHMGQWRQDNRALVTFQGDVGANCPEFPCKRARMRE